MLKILVRAYLVTLATGMIFALPCAAQDNKAAVRTLEPGQIAPLLEGLGDLHHAVTTKSDRAQLFFDQGLRLVYGFNHAEAIRAFKEAQRLDPECAMAYWGEALALGPNLNQPMQPQNVAPAYAAIQKAVSLRAKAAAPEQALIDALAARYAPDAKADRAALDRAYAAAMAKVAAACPADDDAVTLCADAIINTMPWNYYTHDGRPREATGPLLATLETVVARNPKHIGALHLYIHATEEHYPRKAEKAADELIKLTTSAGHLLHMPSHIYMRLGRYDDAYNSNELAIAADENYITQCRAQGLYPLNYYPHNVHFLMWAAERQGRAGEAIFQARKVSQQAHDHMAGAGFALYDTFYVMPFYMMVRFGRWDEILAAPVPEENAAFVRAIWHFARSIAQTSKGNAREAAKELKALQEIGKSGNFGGTTVGLSDPHVLLTIAANVAEGELAAASKKYDAATLALDRAIRFEDELTYNEPPDWPLPARQRLGAVLLKAERPAEAESVYWADLKKNPENPYSLFGLWQALQAQKGREADAAAVKARFDATWKKADHPLTSSVY